MFGHRTLRMQERRGLVGYWPLANRGAVDLKSYGGPYQGNSTMTNNGSVTRAAGPSVELPDAAHFVVANSQYLSLAGGTKFNIGRLPFAFALWAQADDVASQSFRHLIAKALTLTEWRVYRTDASGQVTFDVIDSTGPTTITTTVSPGMTGGTWFLVVGWWDGVKSNLRVYNATTKAVTSGRSALSASQAGVRVTTENVTFSNNINANSRWSGDLAHGRLWIGNVPSTRFFDWLFANGPGRPTVPLG